MIREEWSRTIRLSGPSLSQLEGVAATRVFSQGCSRCDSLQRAYAKELGLRRRIVAYVVCASIVLLLVRLFLGVFYG